MVLSSLVLGCSSDTEEPELLTNAGIRQLVREQWQYNQTFLRECLSEAGFEWTAIAFDDEAVLLPTGDNSDARLLDVTLTADEATRNGFGVVVGISKSVGQSQNEDPNSAYAAGLSPAEYSAYLLALDSEGGCRERADAATEDEFAQTQLELTQSFDQLQSFILSSPEFRQIADQWAACMADRGWDDAVLTDFDQRIREDLDVQLAEVTVTREPEGEGDAPVRQIPPADLQRIREYETGAAVAYVQCFEPHRADYTELVDAAYETL
jgi:hypothetical protein